MPQPAQGAPFTAQFYLYVVLTALSVCTLVRLLTSLDASAVRQRLQGRVSEPIAGGALVGMGLLFTGLVLQIITDPASMPLKVATGVADPALLVGGALLWRRQPCGYVLGAGLLFLVSMLFVGLLVFFILQPLIARQPFPADDFAVIAFMSLICFVPFGLFVRGVQEKE